MLSALPLPAPLDLPLDVLVVAPHPDDAELGMGGAIVKMIDEGRRVGILDLTTGEPTPNGTPEIRQQETAAASEILGVTWRFNAGLPNRMLVADLPSRAHVASIIRLTRPRFLFAPYWVDAHPDHAAATELVEGARFWAKLTKTDLPGQPDLAHEPCHPERIYYYYCIHLRLAVQPAVILDISDQWDKKLAAIRCFESQFITGRSQDGPTMLDRFRDDAAYWGKLINRRYGEPFTTREPLALDSFNSLV